jgi:hypothetical protein
MRPHILPNLARGWPRLRGRRLAAACAAMTVLLGLTGYGIAAAAASSGPASTTKLPASAASGPGVAAGYNAAAGTTVPGQPQLPPQSLVTLPTADRVVLDTAPDGQQTANPEPSAGTPAGSSGFVRFTWDGDQYLVPDDAAAYLASGVLDPRLFDVSYLASLGKAASSGLPVQVTYTGTGVPSLPGLDITSASGGTATATLLTAQAAQFGSLLASQQAAALASHSAPGHLPGITRIALAQPDGGPALPPSPVVPGQSAASAGRPGQPGLPYKTLTLNFTAPDGSAGTAIGLLQNLADSNLSPGDQQPSGVAGEPGIILAQAQGSYSLTVPAGTYSAEFSIITPESGSLTGYSGALVSDPQFSVTSDTTVTLDARTAVPYHVTLGGVTAPPVQTDVLTVERSSATGPATPANGIQLELSGIMGLISISGDGYTGSQLSASPTAAVTTGTFGFQATTLLGATLPFGSPPEPDSTYLLNFAYSGQVPSSLSFTVPRAALTAYRQQLYANPLGTCGNSDLMTDYIYNSAGDVQEWQYLVPPTGSRTDYWYDSNPQLDAWQPQAALAVCGTAQRIFMTDAPRQIRHGGQVAESWGKAPTTAPPPAAPSYDFTPGMGESGLDPTTPLLTLCPVCRQDDNAFVTLSPYGDSDPAHYYSYGPWGDTSPDIVTLYRNGTPVDTSSGPCQNLTTGAVPTCGMTPTGLELPLLGPAASYQLDVSYPDWPGNTTATTTVEWTFQSAPDPAAGKLPGNELCAPDPTRGCAYLPLLFIDYDLALNDAGQAPAGQPFPVTFTVTHQQGEAPPPGVSATVSASFDNGTTWTTPQAATSLGRARFTTTIQQPALADTSGFVSLRVTARDSNGSSVTETLIEAYGLAS